MEVLNDVTDPRLDDFRHLTDRQARRKTELSRGIFIVEGSLAIEQLDKSNHDIRSILVTPNRQSRIKELIPYYDRRGIEVLVAERAVLKQVTGFDVHRGMLASAVRKPLPHATELVSDVQSLVVAEAVNDNENVGSMFRNAAAFGFGAVLLDNACADPLYRRSIRVSLGWSLRIPHARVESAAKTIARLREEGFTTVALTPSEGATAVDEAANRGLVGTRTALVVGAEGSGLTAAAIEACDLCVQVPMYGEVDSLNVATSLAVVGAFVAATRGWK